MIKGWFHQFALITILVFLGSAVLAQSQSDTIIAKTPFRKGKWITGLSGSINTGTNSLESTGSDKIRNQYSMDYRMGNFVRNRFLVGGLISLSRINNEEFASENQEILTGGPLATWYFTNGEQGSLFLSGAGVFVKFRDEAVYSINDVQNQSLVKGTGAGMLVRFGYSYVLHDRVAFDLAINYSRSWLAADKIDQNNIKENVNFNVTDLSFTFGFSVILDNFFF